MTRSLSMLLGLFFFFSWCVLNTPAQSPNPEALANDFVKAWNSHEAKAFDRLFIDKAVWVPVANVRTEGREQIVKDFAEIHTTWAKSTTVSINTVKIQQLRPDVAVILFHLKFLENGKELEEIDRAMVIVAVKQAGKWKIATGQITKQHEGA